MMTTGYRLIGAALATSLGFASSQAANIPEGGKAASDFRSLLKATETAGLSSFVGGRGSFTMFAPNDAGFAKVPQAKLDMLMQIANRAKMALSTSSIPW